MDIPVLPQSVRIRRKQARHNAAIARLAARLVGPGRYIRAAEQLRAQADEAAEFGYVACQATRLLGSVQFWHIRIGATPGFLLGPLLVAPSVQGKGIGRHLLASSLRACPGLVMLIGDANYYAPSGFQSLAFHTPPLLFPAPVARPRVLVRAPKGFAIAKLAGKVEGVAT